MGHVQLKSLKEGSDCKENQFELFRKKQQRVVQTSFQETKHINLTWRHVLDVLETTILLNKNASLLEVMSYTSIKLEARLTIAPGNTENGTYWAPAFSKLKAFKTRLKAFLTFRAF